MKTLSFKKNKENYEVNVCQGKTKKSSYHTILNHDYRQITQVLIDLYLEGFPIEKAIVLFEERIKTRDWLGIRE